MSSESESAQRAREEWERNELHRFVKRQPEAKERYETLSGLPVKRVYTPEDRFPLARSVCLDNIPSRAAPIRRCIAAETGQCDKLPATAPAKTPTVAFAI